MCFKTGFPGFKTRSSAAFFGVKNGGEDVDRGLTTPLSRTQGVNIYGFKSLEPNEALFDKRREAGGRVSKKKRFQPSILDGSVLFFSSKLDVFSSFFCSFLERRPVNLCVWGKESN